MLELLATQWKRGAATLGRRELFRRSALLTLPALFRAEPALAAPAAAQGPRAVDDVYRSIGVLKFEPPWTRPPGSMCTWTN